MNIFFDCFDFPKFFSVEIFHMMSRLRMQFFSIIGQEVPALHLVTDRHTNYFSNIDSKIYSREFFQLCLNFSAKNLIKNQCWDFFKHCVFVSLLVVHQTCVNKPWFAESLSGTEKAKEEGLQKSLDPQWAEKLFSSNFLCRSFFAFSPFPVLYRWYENISIAESAEVISEHLHQQHSMQFYSMQYICWFP